MNPQRRPSRTPAAEHRTPATAPGFSLIEILVVVAIISILTSLAVVASIALTKQGQVSSTKTLLQQLQSIEAEYRIQAGRAAPHDDRPDGAPEFVDSSIEYFVYRAMNVPEARDMMKTVNPQRFKDTDGDGSGDTVLDAFETPIEYRDSVKPSDNDPDGLPVHPSPYFASAGVDEEFGTKDDLYSFEVD